MQPLVDHKKGEKNMKKLLAIMLVLCVLCFSGCGLFKELIVEMDKANALVKDFCQCLVENDIEGAKALMHPQSKPSANNLSNNIYYWEKNFGIDFSKGLGNKTSFSMQSNGTSEGMEHEIAFSCRMEDKIIHFEFVVVSDSAGYGIYSVVLSD